MASAIVKRPAASHIFDTAADLVRKLGDIPLQRIRLQPPIGTATEKDVLVVRESPERRLCELVDGVLVEKVMGTKEALLSAVIVQILWNFVEARDLGLVLGADGMVRLKIGLVRIPDVCFISWDRLPAGELPDEAIAGVVPDLAVEVLSKGNTEAEMKRKLREYFQAGVRLVWLIEPKTQTARVYASPTKMQQIVRDEALDGGQVLPGFVLPLKQLFARSRRRRKGR
jgi:Uma2 family endonuclease